MKETVKEPKQTEGDKIAQALYECTSDPDLIGGGGSNMSLVYAIYRVGQAIHRRNDIEEKRNEILREIADTLSCSYQYWSTGLRP